MMPQITEPFGDIVIVNDAIGEAFFKDDNCTNDAKE